VGTQRSLLWLLLRGVGVLLLIACANTAQLLLARSLRRGREIAIRAALGASRLRLIRQFLLEGLVLAACGGIAGLLAAGWILRALVILLPVRSPLLASAHLDARAIGFTLAISLISALVFATIPALKGSLWTLGPSLNARASGGEGNRWRHAMIAIEAIPGVDSAATVTGPPLRPARGGNAELVGERDGTGALKSIRSDNHLVSSDYFRAGDSATRRAYASHRRCGATCECRNRERGIRAPLRTGGEHGR